MQKLIRRGLITTPENANNIYPKLHLIPRTEEEKDQATARGEDSVLVRRVSNIGDLLDLPPDALVLSPSVSDEESIYHFLTVEGRVVLDPLPEGTEEGDMRIILFNRTPVRYDGILLDFTGQ